MNPCFVQRQDDGRKHLLKQNEMIRLEIGDRFSLLPDCHTFVVKKRTTLTDPVSRQENMSETQLLSDSNCACKEEPVQPPTPTLQLEESENESLNSTCLTEPRSSPPPVPQKVAKVEPMRPQNQTVSTIPPRPTTSATNTTRIPCQYGDSCYRKNPIHFKKFSHPSDTDYSTSLAVNPTTADRTCPPCRYGATCYRKNPQHFAENWHPPQNQRANRTCQSVTTLVISVTTGADEDDNEEEEYEDEDDEEYVQDEEIDNDEYNEDDDEDEEEYADDDEDEDDLA